MKERWGLGRLALGAKFRGLARLVSTKAQVWETVEPLKLVSTRTQAWETVGPLKLVVSTLVWEMALATLVARTATQVSALVVLLALPRGLVKARVARGPARVRRKRRSGPAVPQGGMPSVALASTYSFREGPV